MKHYWKRLHSYRQWQPKTGTRQICRVIFIGGHLLRKAVRHPIWKILVIIFIWIDKGHVVINSVRNIWIFIMANSRNVDLTEKKHSRHQQFWRFPLSPLEASSRLPRSRDHLFSHSIPKASLSQGPYMWYLTFYKNKVPIYQTPISNSLYFKLATFVRNCEIKPVANILRTVEGENVKVSPFLKCGKKMKFREQLKKNIAYFI